MVKLIQLSVLSSTSDSVVVVSVQRLVCAFKPIASELAGVRAAVLVALYPSTSLWLVS